MGYSLAGEKADYVIQRLIEAFDVTGIPKIVEADNAPAYLSAESQQSLQGRDMEHQTPLLTIHEDRPLWNVQIKF